MIYAQDAAQLERIFYASAFAQRNKWRRRHDYSQSTIAKAFEDVGETYD